MKPINNNLQTSKKVINNFICLKDAQLKTVQKLINQYPQLIKTTCRRGNTALHHTAIKGDVALVKLLLKTDL